jgi:hypothetical protein
VATDNAPAHNAVTNVIRVISDIVRPTCLIVSPSPSQRWSNAVITVKGRAQDNLPVAGVWCLTNGVWGLASASNGTWANWTMDVALLPGLNTVRAYAVDAAGNKSPTNGVTCSYVLSDRLTLATTGQGTLAPNYSNAVLEIGKTYSITASPVLGFAFTNWTGSLTTNAATLRFVMQSNLMFTANFVDVQKPTIVVTSPRAGQRWSNAVFTVKGTARDNRQVAMVWCQTNGVWGMAPTANGWANWTMDVTLLPGANTVKSYAVDTAGNRSLTNTASINYIVSDRLTLLTSGVGQVSPNYSNAVLEIGKRYTITASPGTGCVFSNWTGSVLSSASTLTFTMASNLVLQANFVPNPFLTLKGVYNGLFCDDPEFPQATNSGFFSLNLNTDGRFSGKLLLAGATLPFTGAFNVQREAQVNVARWGKPAVPMALQLWPEWENLDTGEWQTNLITGTVSVGNPGSELEAYRAASSRSNALTGAYTLLLQGCESGSCFGDPAGAPWGDGPAAVKVTSAGAIQMMGTLADGVAVSQSTSVSEGGWWPVYVSLYSGRGMLWGWQSLDPDFPNDLVLYWQMPPAVLRSPYVNGLNQPRLALVTPYTVPAAGKNAVNWTNAEVRINGRGLTEQLTSQVILSNNTFRVLGGSVSNLTLSVSGADGLFRGSFVHPITKRVTALKGALEPKQDPAPAFPQDSGGWWLGTNGEGGIIRILPQ